MGTIASLSVEPYGWHSARLGVAFRQKFHTYAHSVSKYGAVVPSTHENALEVLDNAFGEGARDAASITFGKRILEHPEPLLSFVTFNVGLALGGDLYWSNNGGHPLISRVTVAFLFAGWLAMGWAAWRTRRYWILLITRPIFFYFADAAFIAMLGCWMLPFPKRGFRVAGLVVSALLVVSVVDLCTYPYSNKPLGDRRHLERALFVRRIVEEHNLAGLMLGEFYLIFSHAFD